MMSKYWVILTVLISMAFSFLPLATAGTADIFYSSGAYKGWPKIPKSKMTEEQLALYQEHYRDDIVYCLANWGKKSKDIDRERNCTTGGDNSPVSYYMIGLKYMSYGDLVKAAEYYHKDWLESTINPNWEPFSGDADEVSVVISGYEAAGMYKDALPFYEKAYARLISRVKVGTDSDLLSRDFNAYREKWPDMAEEYTGFMKNWERAKKLSKNSKPKPLDQAVQNHEWFYSEKPEEALKALEYYNANKVVFMLEKAVSSKDPNVAAKAGKYLEELKKQTGRP